MKEKLLYSKMTIAEMFVRYNEHAVKIGKPPMKKRPKDRVAIARDLALILTHRIPPPVMMRDIAVQELCRVSHYELHGVRLAPDADIKRFPSRDLVSVGFSYDDVMARVKERAPASKITVNQLWVHNTGIRHRKKGYRQGKLPGKRLRCKGIYK